MPKFIGKFTRVCSNSKQSVVPCGLYGTILCVIEHNSKKNGRYEILWDNYIYGLYFNRNQFDVLQNKDNNFFQELFEKQVRLVKRHEERKKDQLSYWRKLDEEQIWHHHYAVMARNIVPVSHLSDDSKQAIEVFYQIDNQKLLDTHKLASFKHARLPAEGSIVCSVQNSTVRGGLTGTVTSTKCVNGLVTFYILWNGFHVSINYSIEEFTVTEYAGLTEHGEDLNISLSLRARESGIKPPIIKTEYKQQDAKSVFDVRRRNGNETFDF
jgi:hypothetical protein